MKLIAFVTATQNRRRAGTSFPQGQPVAVELTGEDDPILDKLRADPVLAVEVKEVKAEATTDGQQDEPPAEPAPVVPETKVEPTATPAPADPAPAEPDAEPAPAPVEPTDEEKRLATLRDFLSEAEKKPGVGATEAATGVNTSGKEIDAIWQELHASA